MLIALYFINTAIIALVVLMHYEALNYLNKKINQLHRAPRRMILFGVFGALLAHIAEIWVFAGSYFLMLNHTFFGTFTGAFSGTLLDCAYFSFTTYTSLGFGDIEPSGNIRFLVGLEALTGLFLISWTASFLFLEMQKLWTKYND